MKDIIKIAAGLIIVGTLVAVAFAIFNVGKKNAEDSASNISNMLNEKSDRYAYYKDTSILGSEVIELFGNNDGVSVEVTTGAGAVVNYNATTKETSTAEYTNSKKTSYINPSKTFRCTSVDYNSNGVIVSLSFVQN
jgi:hypothetical protein